MSRSVQTTIQRHVSPLSEIASGQPHVIFREGEGAGFWSNFCFVLQEIDYADCAGGMPFVDMRRFPNRYTETSPVNGTLNAWEYYFEQPSDLCEEAAYAIAHSISKGETAGRLNSILDPVPHAFPARSVIERGRELVRKYIRVRPEILTDVDQLLPPGNNPDVLGVHVRGTDMRQGAWLGHPIPDVAEAYLEKANELDATHSFRRVFLATDEEEVVALFEKTFQERLLVTSAHRTPRGVNTSMDYEWLFSQERPLHRYRLGREVLVDVLLLARCGQFIGGMSNVASATLYFSSPQIISHPMLPIWMTPVDDAHGDVAARFRQAILELELPIGTTEVMHQRLKLFKELLYRSETQWAEANRRHDSVAQKLQMVENNAKMRSNETNVALSEARIEIKALKKILNQHKTMWHCLRSGLKSCSKWLRMGFKMKKSPHECNR